MREAWDAADGLADWGAGWDLTADPDALPPEDLPDGVHTVVLGIGDLNGILRGKRVTAAHWPSVRRRGIALDNTFFAMDVGSLLIPNGYSGRDTGFPDLQILPRGPLRPIPWEPGVALVLGRAQERDGTGIPIDPRRPLLRAVAQAAELGFSVRLAAELEFYLVDPQTRRPLQTRAECYGLGRAAELEPVLGPLRRGLERMGIPVEQSNPEFSAGQVEVNLRHAPALDAIDHAVIFRGMVKQFARLHGLTATFMPKPFAEAAGSGFHLHHSLWRDGANAFAEAGRLSEAGRHYLGGLQAMAAEASLVGSAHPNAYRRRRPYTYAPVDASWGVDNRSVAFRVMEGIGPEDDGMVRVEDRTASADCNPYLFAAAGLAAGLRGMAQRIEPTRPSPGDAYGAASRAPLPRTIQEAMAAARASAFLAEALGATERDLLVLQAERELESLDVEIPPAEIARYFDVM